MENMKDKVKSFWDRPEGTTGMIVGVSLFALGGYFLYQLLPFIITLLENTIHALILFVVAAVLVFLVTSTQVRNMLWYGFKVMMRWITKWFVDLDPIIIMETYVGHARDLLVNMEKQIEKLRGQMRQLKTDIDNQLKEMKNSFQLASKAKEKGQQNQMLLQSRQAGRLKESTMTLNEMYLKMEALYKRLSHIHENTELMVEDLSNDVQLKKKERLAIIAAHKAMSSAIKFMKGDSKKELFDAAMESMAEDVGNKIGELERFMEVSNKFVDGVDLQNGVYEEDGLKLLEQWELDSDSFFLTTASTPKMLNQANTSNMLFDANNLNNKIDVRERVKVSNNTELSDEYSNMLRK